MEVQIITSEFEKVKITRHILQQLPEWFGIPAAREAYVEQAKNCQMLACFFEEEPVAFITVNQKFTHSAEIDAMGVLPAYHRQGLGRKLMTEAKKQCRARNVAFLQVKTLSADHPDLGYAKTRQFYQEMGFVPLDLFPDLWGQANPCLQLILSI